VKVLENPHDICLDRVPTILEESHDVGSLSLGAFGVGLGAW